MPPLAPIAPITLGTMIAEGHRDPIAVTKIATLLAKEWCDQWGGWDKCDTPERIAQIWAHRPAARKLARTLGAATNPDATPEDVERAVEAALDRYGAAHATQVQATLPPPADLTLVAGATGPTSAGLNAPAMSAERRAPDDTLTIDKMREAIRSLGAPVPDFIVTVYAIPGKPTEYLGTVYLAPEDAKTLHAKSPLILRQRIGSTSGRYSIASPFDGPFPVDLPVPPYETTA